MQSGYNRFAESITLDHMRPKSRQCVTVPHSQDGGGIRKNEVRRFCGRFGSMAEARRAVGASEAQSSIQEEPMSTQAV